jgi:hypothetical protein
MLRKVSLVLIGIVLVGLLGGCAQVQLSPATSVTMTGATLRATVKLQPNDYGEYWWESSTDGQNWTPTAHQAYGAPNPNCQDNSGPYTQTTITKNLSNLQPQTRYYFRLAATDCGAQYVVDSTGAVMGRDATASAIWSWFRTLGPSDGQLATILNHPDQATAASYGTTDSAGHSMDTPSVIQLVGQQQKYAAVYHTLVGGLFQINLATSNDLIHWQFRRTLINSINTPSLQQSASHPRITRVAGSEWIVIANEMGYHWPSHDSDDSSQVHFSLYYNDANLLSGTAASTYDMLPWSQVSCNGALHFYNGTPSFYDAHLVQNGGLYSVDGQYGFTYLTPNQNLNAVTSISRMFEPGHTPVPASSSATAYNGDFQSAGASGGVGQRDTLQTSSGRFSVQEANLGPAWPCNRKEQDFNNDGPFNMWRVWLYKFSEPTKYPTGAGSVTPLFPTPDAAHMPDGSWGTANPSVAVVDNPSGTGKVLLVSYFIFGSAGPGAGSLMYYSPFTP